MIESNFTYLLPEYPKLSNLGKLAEANVFNDPSTSLSKLRIFCELLSKFIVKFESVDEYDRTTQETRIYNLSREDLIPAEIFDALHSIRKSGNKASHSGDGSTSEAKLMLKKTVRISRWFYAMYEGEVVRTEFIDPKPQADLSESLKELEQALLESEEERKNQAEKIEELQRRTPAQIEERKEIAAKSSKLEENEAETRQRIDLQLRDAGWYCDTDAINYKTHKTLPEKGKAIAIAEWKCGSKWADYALFIGMELVGIIEAKKHSKNVMSTLEQAREYSELALPIGGITFPRHLNEARYKIPFIFSTNGKPYLEQFKEVSGIWYWDARSQTNAARALRGWFSPEDLKEKLTYNEDEGAENLKNEEYNYLEDTEGLGLRPYQIDAIEALEAKMVNQPNDRRALIAMATGTGKTRTMIGMCYRLIKTKKFRRVLFLVDRTMLGEQAADSFGEVKVKGLKTFSQIYVMKGLATGQPELETRMHFATVQSLVKQIAYSDNPPSVGDYDCIVVDEAHRGYTLDRDMDDEEIILRNQLDFQSKYRMVLDYFDAYRIGLTATPAVHTKEIFGDPVFTYSYRKAVVDNYLIDFEPPYVFQTELKENDIVWKAGDRVKIYDPEENEIVDTGVTEDEIAVDVTGFNKKVINESFNREIIKHLIEEYGLDPEDKGKTLIFATNNVHADMIVRLLFEEFSNAGIDLDEDSIKKITGEVKSRKELLRKYKNDQFPGIVVTVDLLTTGIDVPSISNLVFFRRVNSRILYDQMVGRATRKCDDIGKEIFKIYDCVGVTEIMSKENVMKPVAPLPTKSFSDIIEELAIIEDEHKKNLKLDRLIAKLNRKVRSLDEEQTEKLSLLSDLPDVNAIASHLKSKSQSELDQAISDLDNLWNYLDKERGNKSYNVTLYSEHIDKVTEVTRAYDKNLKPKDYLESFEAYIRDNRNTIAALNIVCTKPSSLTRKDLKTLKLILDEEGFTKTQLNAARKEVTNEEIVADIIAHVRTTALGTALISHTQRISGAMNKLRSSHDWTKVQLKWLEKIEGQLLQENIISEADLNEPPFKADGGKKRLDRIFKTDTKEIINELNTYLYQQA